MASSVSDYGAAYWLGQLFNLNGAAATYWLAVMTDDGDTGYDGTLLADIEPPTTDVDGVATSYARVQVGTGSSNWSATEGGFTGNLNDVAFAAATGEWGTITDWALCSAATGGQVYCFGEFSNPQAIIAGTQFVAPPGSLNVTMSGATNTIVA